MYVMTDTASAVKDIQKFLSGVRGGVFVAPSGVYDDSTRSEILEFQKNEELEPTGVTDKETLDNLYTKYLKANTVKAIVKKEGDIFPLGKGDRSSKLLMINGMIAEVLNYYALDLPYNTGALFSEYTLEAVRRLRRLYRLEESDIIDEIFYYRLERDFRSIKEISASHGNNE